MTDNSGEVISANSGKKRIRKAFIFLSFIPFAVISAVQTVTTLPGIILAMIDMQKQGLPMEMSVMMEIFNQKYGLISYVSYCLICFAVFIPWYYKGIVKKNPKVIYRRALGARPLAVGLSVMICLFFVIDAAFVVVDKLFPEVIEHYNELMSVTSLGSNIYITVIYGYILGPITEELCFRGVTYGLLERSGIHHMLAISIQALLFGVLHMNLVQGVYAFFLGMILGYLRYKYKTLFISVFAHMIFNFFGIFVEQCLENFGVTDVQKMLFGLAAALISAALIYAVVKDREKYVEEKAGEVQVTSCGSSDFS